MKNWSSGEKNEKCSVNRREKTGKMRGERGKRRRKRGEKKEREEKRGKKRKSSKILVKTSGEKK